jgi:endonuclease/exonuclease/phosphatase family metal-dependent hydrolase
MDIASWNVARGLSDKERSPQIKRGLETLDADIIVLSEAYDVSGKPFQNDFAEELGYRSFSTEYEDQQPHPSDKQFITVLSRVAMNASVIRLATRNAIQLNFDGKDGANQQLIGVHFDDRNAQIRNLMAYSIAESINPSTSTLVVGDLNSMHEDDWRARIIGSPLSREVAHSIPVLGTEGSKVKLDRIRSILTRLTEMADGKTQEILTEAGFQETDPTYRPTLLLGSFAIAQLDHILHTANLKSQNFQTYRLAGSDHKAISATISES